MEKNTKMINGFRIRLEAVKAAKCKFNNGNNNSTIRIDSI